MQTGIRIDHTMISVDHDELLHVMFEITGPATGDDERPPVALALVLDRSGSMGGPKLQAASACAVWLAERLRPDDRLALVSFDHEVAVEVPLTAVSSGAVAAAAAGLQAGGTTNLSGGWLRGLSLLDGDPAPTRRILLLTDGMANVGVTDVDKLVRIAGGGAERGIATTTIGFGEGFDEDLLTAMADAGRGAAHYAASPDDAAAVFAEEAADLAALVAQNVTVGIRPVHPGVRSVDVLGDWPAHAEANVVRASLGDVYAGRTRRLVFALDVRGLQDMGPCQVAEIELDYTSIGDDIATHASTLPVTVHVATAADARAAGIDTQVREQVAVLAAAAARRRAIELADAGDVDGAKSALRGAAMRLRMTHSDMVVTAAMRAEADALDQDVAGDWDVAQRKSMRYKANRSVRNREQR